MVLVLDISVKSATVESNYRHGMTDWQRRSDSAEFMTLFRRVLSDCEECGMDWDWKEKGKRTGGRKVTEKG